MPSDLYNAVMALPIAQQAVDLLQGQAAAFAYVPARLDTLRRTLVAIQSAASAQGDGRKAAAASAMLVGLTALQSYYARTSGNVSGVVEALRSSAPGISVAAFVPKLISAAAAVPLLFRSVDLFEKSVRSLQTGTLTPDEIARLQRGGYTPAAAGGVILKYALYVGGGYLVYRWLRRH